MTQELAEVNNVNGAPYPGVARLETVRSRGVWIIRKKAYFHGSGMLINSRYVLTAGHNALNDYFSNFVSANVSLGYNHEDALWESPRAYNNSDIRIANGYKFKVYQLDYAVIDLGLNAPQEHTSFRLPNQGEIKSLMKKGLALYLAGYPGKPHDGHTLKYAYTNNYSQEGALFKYAIDTATGNSGGPIWFEYNGEFILAGVHVAEGKAVLLDGNVLEEINSWL